MSKSKNLFSKAKIGLEDVSELAYTTAEHHPFWGLLYHCSQISKIALEKWDDNFTKEELDEIIKELKSGKLKNIAERSGRAQDKDDGGGLETLRRDGYM